MLAGEGKATPCSLLLRDPVHVMVERIIDSHLSVHRDRYTSLLREIRVAHGMLRPACRGHAKVRRPPRLFPPCRGRNKQADRSWLSATVCLAQAAPRRRLHSLALPLAACRLRLPKVRRHESREF